jgi:DNA polymerase-3 subunit beta
MEFKVEKALLVSCVDQVQKAASKKEIVPILGGIYIRVAGNRLEMRATDLELEINTSIPIIAGMEGDAVVPAKHFAEIVRRLPSGEVSLAVENQVMKIKYGKSSLTINTLPASEFPASEESAGEIVTLNSQKLKHALKKVLVACSQNTDRPIFTGVFFEFSDDALTLVATDTHRLALNRFQYNGQIPKQKKILIPGKSLLEVIRILSDSEDEEVSVTISDKRVMFKKDDTVITTRLIAGEFPNYKNVIPTEFSTTCKVSGRLFYDSINRASLLNKNDDSKIKSLKMTINGVLQINAVASEIGEINEEIAINDKNGEDIEIKFTSSYLLDASQSAGAEELELRFSGSTKPCIIKPTNNEDYLYLLLPIR